MNVTVYFIKTEGPKQVSSINFRIDTEDILDAVAQAITQASIITTIAIERLVVEALT